MHQALPGKRRDRVQTKARILAAAQRAFSELGYSQVGIRDIAARADVTSPMLLHYFGSKMGLFEAALVEAISLRQKIFDGPREDFGRQMMQLISDPDAEIHAPVLIAMATGDAEAQAVTARITKEYAVLPMAEWLGAPDGYARAVQITLLTVSYVQFSRQVPLVSPQSDTERKVIDWMADAIQRIVDRV